MKSEKTTSAAFQQQLQSHKDRIKSLEKDMKQIKSMIYGEDNWHTTIRDWIGNEVYIIDANNIKIAGILKWVDNDALCLKIVQVSKQNTIINHRIYTKQRINYIEQV